MKNISHRVISFILSLCLVITIFLSCYVPVYAGGFLDYLDGLTIDDYIAYWASQVGVILDSHDFSQWVQNNTAYEDYFKKEYIKFDDSSNTVTMDSDFSNYLKQALIDYQDEMYGYYIVKTRSMYELTINDFNSSYEYKTACNLLNKYGIIGLSAYRTNVTKNVYDLSPYISHKAGFYMSGYDTRVRILDYDTWENVTLQGYPLYFQSNKIELDKPYTDFDELCEYWTSLYHSGRITTNPLNLGFAHLWSWYQFATGAFQDPIAHRPDPYIITQKGSNIMVFKSMTALMNYSVNKRSVFITPDFNDFSGEISGSLEDLADSIDKMADIFQQFQDALGNYENSDRLTESELEDLLQQILDAIKEGNSGNNSGDDSKTDELLQQILEQLTNLVNKINSGSGSGSSGSGSSDSKDYTGFFGSILEYLDMIVEYLAGILDGIENLVFLEWTDQDEDIGDLSDIIKGIKDDPEAGSQAAADYLTTSFSDIATGLTKKFPFSIPWDLYALFSVFSEVDSPKAVSAPSGTILPYSIRDGDIQLLDGAGHSSPGIVEPEASNAPYFKLPLVIESARINENIIIDLAGFQSVSVLSRTLFTVLFALFLLKLTLKIMPLFKGGDGD